MNRNGSRFSILDTTLRDGSYSVNFSFTAEDTAIICKQLEDSGVDYIEIGHGVGIGASEKGYGQAIASDKEYVQVANKTLTKAKFGMFCIPGIAELDDLRMAADNGMGFIRIGVDANDVAKSEEFIKLAKSQGMIVMVNFMKSYTMSPEQFVNNVLIVEKYGADVVYIVDSAGGMFAEDLADYIAAIKVSSNIKVGFHGHNNLGLAVANSIAAVESGASFVDVSLQGIGRSAGNACFELFLAAIIKKGYQSSIDLLKVLDISEKIVRPFLTKPGYFSLDTVAGFSDFHSSYMKYIHKYSSRYSIKPELLMIEYSKINKLDIDEETLERVAKNILDVQGENPVVCDFSRYHGEEQNGR